VGSWLVASVSAVTVEQYFPPSVTLNYCVVITFNSDKALTMSTQ